MRLWNTHLHSNTRSKHEQLILKVMLPLCLMELCLFLGVSNGEYFSVDSSTPSSFVIKLARTKVSKVGKSII